MKEVIAKLKKKEEDSALSGSEEVKEEELKVAPQPIEAPVAITAPIPTETPVVETKVPEVPVSAPEVPATKLEVIETPVEVKEEIKAEATPVPTLPSEPIEEPKEDEKFNEIAARINQLNNDGIFRYELLVKLNELNDAVSLLGEVIVKIGGIEKLEK